MDTGSAGVGELEVTVEVGGRPVPVKTIDKGFRIFSVQFTPSVASRHLVYIYFASEQLTGKFCRFTINYKKLACLKVRRWVIDRHASV